MIIPTRFQPSPPISLYFDPMKYHRIIPFHVRHLIPRLCSLLFHNHRLQVMASWDSIFGREQILFVLCDYLRVYVISPKRQKNRAKPFCYSPFLSSILSSFTPVFAIKQSRLWANISINICNGHTCSHMEITHRLFFCLALSDKKIRFTLSMRITLPCDGVACKLETELFRVGAGVLGWLIYPRKMQK